MYVVRCLAGQLGVYIRFVVLVSVELLSVPVFLLSVSILSHARHVGIRYFLNIKEKFTNYILRCENIFYIRRYKYFVGSYYLYIQNSDFGRIKQGLLLKNHQKEHATQSTYYETKWWYSVQTQIYAHGYEAFKSHTKCFNAQAKENRIRNCKEQPIDEYLKVKVNQFHYRPGVTQRVPGN